MVDLNPYGQNAERQLGERTAVSYRGVSFGEWLDLFLEYAVGLAHYERFQESYHVCESARDAEVFAKNKEDMFLIHVTWAGKTPHREHSVIATNMLGSLRITCPGRGDVCSRRPVPHERQTI